MSTSQQPTFHHPQAGILQLFLNVRYACRVNPVFASPALKLKWMMRAPLRSGNTSAPFTPTGGANAHFSLWDLRKCHQKFDKTSECMFESPYFIPPQLKNNRFDAIRSLCALWRRIFFKNHRKAIVNATVEKKVASKVGLIWFELLLFLPSCGAIMFTPLEMGQRDKYWCFSPSECIHVVGSRPEYHVAPFGWE